MPLFRTRSAAILGIDAHLIDVEVDMYPGAGARLHHGRHAGHRGAGEPRAHQDRAANSGFGYPTRSVTINLAPANVRKEGAGFDLPMAVGILGAMGAVPPLRRPSVRGRTVARRQHAAGARRAVDRRLRAAAKGSRNLLVPAENAREAAVVDGVRVFGVRASGEVVALLRSRSSSLRACRAAAKSCAGSRARTALDFQDVRGQTTAKRALEVAAAGAHNVLMIGPPGSGKTMLAQAPAGDPAAARLSRRRSRPRKFTAWPECCRRAWGCWRAAVPRAASHDLRRGTARRRHREFPRPGEVSLAHHGVLFLDELPEFPRNVLELLRQPLEERSVTIARAQHDADVPGELHADRGA